MKKKLYYIGLVAIIFLSLSLWAWFKSPMTHSDAERRPLATVPSVSVENIENGEFMTEFEDYTLDQFPLRDKFRALKAFVKLRILGQKDNNDIYMDEDCLISAGNEKTQNTWMDAKYGDFPATPRNGKAVEMNSLWYNALKTAETLSLIYGYRERANKYKAHVKLIPQ